MSSSCTESSSKTLKMDLNAILCNARLEIFKEIEKIRSDTSLVGLDVSENLNIILEELLESIREYASEIKEVLEEECVSNSIELVDEVQPKYDFPDDCVDGGLVTCKRCLFQWDGNAQHICD